LEIEALSADRIEIARRPVAVSDGPQPATSDFSLPELPVSINIGEITADSLVLGETVLGVPAELRLEGGGRLEGGAGEATLLLDRIDGQSGTFNVSAAYANDTRVLALDLALDEGADGIVASVTGLPGGAPLSFDLSGTGPLDAYTADLALATDGADRIGGRVTLNRDTPDAPLDFTASLAGDPTALMAPDYREFFGNDVSLTVAGQRDAAGRLDLSTLDITAEALSLAGQAVIGPGGWPEQIELTGAGSTAWACPSRSMPRRATTGSPTSLSTASRDPTCSSPAPRSKAAARSRPAATALCRPSAATSTSTPVASPGPPAARPRSSGPI